MNSLAPGAWNLATCDPIKEDGKEDGVEPQFA
jgi:hypothetical protein